jgi:LysR family transcriptional regulator, transcriptional activator of the cysJI operon
MEFYQLEILVTVMQKRSFSKAAESLYLSQPTVSAHIKSLENELGLSLFDRGKNDMLPTPAGEALYRYASDLLDLRAAALADLCSMTEVGEETVTISASSVPCQYLLPQAAARFEQTYPAVSIALKQENSQAVCEDVFKYRYVLGVVGERHELPQLIFKPLMADELVVAIPNQLAYKELLESDTLVIHDLARFPLLLRESGSGTRSLLERELSNVGVNLDGFKTRVYNNQETIKQAVRQGVGVTVLSRFVVQDYERFGLVATRPLDGLDLRRQFYLVYHGKRVLSPAVKQVRDFLLTFFSG